MNVSLGALASAALGDCGPQPPASPWDEWFAWYQCWSGGTNPGSTPATSSPVVVPPSTPSTPAPPVTYSPSVSFIDNTNAGKYYAGDSFTIRVTGGKPNSAVQVVQNGGAATTMGSTDAAGNATISGSWGMANVGSYTQTWYVGGQAASPTLAFTVAVEPCPAGYHSNVAGLSGLAACVAITPASGTGTPAYQADLAIVMAAIPTGDTTDVAATVLTNMYAAGFAPGTITASQVTSFLTGVGGAGGTTSVLSNPLVLAGLAAGAFFLFKGGK